MSDEEKKAESLNASGFFAAAVEQFNIDVVEYAKAGPEQKARMDEMIAGMDYKQLNTITTFAQEPAEDLGAVAEKIIKEVQGSNSFMAPFEEFAQAIATFDFETVGKMASSYTEAVSRKIQMAQYSGVMRLFKKATSFSFKEEASIDDIRAEINKSLLQLGEVMANLEEASDKIPAIIENLEDLNMAFTQAYSEYGLYIGAALEKLRLMEQNELPELQTKAKSGSLLAQQEFRSAYKAMTLLNKKITNMDVFHKKSILNLGHIDSMKDALGQSQLNIDEKLTVSENEWKGILATNAVATEVAKVVEVVSEADEFDRKITEQGVKVAEMIKIKADEALNSGQVNALHMVELLKAKAEDMKSEAEKIAQFNKDQKAARAKLDAAGKELLNAATQLDVPLSTDEEAAVEAQTVKLLEYKPSVTLDQQSEALKVTRPNEPGL